VSQLSLDNVEAYIVQDIDDEDTRKRDTLRTAFHNQIRQDIGTDGPLQGESFSREARFPCKTRWTGKSNGPDGPNRRRRRNFGHALPHKLGNDALRLIKGELMCHSIRARHEVYPNFPLEGDRTTINYIVIVSWSQEERDLLEYEDAWRSIPILVDAAGNVLLTAVHSKSLDLNRKAKSKKKGKTKEISQDIIDDTDDNTDAETEPRPESSKGKGKDKGKKRR
ncbi:hypothetical protein H0H92_014885, partial [Tricholoma furcatifolium]